MTPGEQSSIRERAIELITPDYGQRSAMNCFLRAADYYRQAEFHFDPTDPRQLPTFEKMESYSHKFISKTSSNPLV